MQDFGHFFHSRIQFRVSILQFGPKLIQHPGLLVQLDPYVPRHGLQRAQRSTDRLQMLLLLSAHVLLLRQRLVQEPLRTVRIVLQFRVFRCAVIVRHPYRTGVVQQRLWIRSFNKTGVGETRWNTYLSGGSIAIFVVSIHADAIFHRLKSIIIVSI